MDEMALQDKPTILSRIAGMFARTEEIEDSEYESQADPVTPALRQSYRYTVTVRKQVGSFEDAMAAANGLKRGEMQIINLVGVDALTKQKIVDFMSGVNYAQEGTWEEIGQDVYLVAPSHAYVEVAPATPRMNALRN